jgi:sulfur relay (sulfurtransferase) complex TusBCD TusD component (DsrE family)
MSATRRKLGILLSVPPEHRKFAHGIRLAEAALEAGVDVFLYCIDDAVSGLKIEGLQSLRERGLKLFGCAFSAHKRNLPLDANATYSGLAILSDIISGTDRFVSF